LHVNKSISHNNGAKTVTEIQEWINQH